MDWNFVPDNLRLIVKESGLTREEIANATGVPVGTLSSYLRERPSAPSVRNLIALADFFAVPLDLITGRCDKELADKLLSDYSRYFMELRRAPYEAYLNGRSKAEGTTSVDVTGEAPWPYNLIEAVLCKDTECLVSADLEAGIMAAIDKLSAQQKTFILAYFRDGFTFAKLGERENTTPGKVHHTIELALRRMRHPSLRNYFLYGKTGAERLTENRQAQEKLDKWGNELEALHERLKHKQSILLSLQKVAMECSDDVAKHVKSFNYMLDSLPDDDMARIRLYDTPIEDLELPYRVLVCLKGKNFNTLGEVMELIESGKLLDINQIGKASATLILTKIKELTGKDCFADYGLSK